MLLRQSFSYWKALSGIPTVQSLALADLRAVLTEFLGSIGGEGSAAEAERERQRVKRMLIALGQEPTEDAQPQAAPIPTSGSEPGVR